MPYVQLPTLEAPKNRLLDFSAIGDAADSWRKGQEFNATHALKKENLGIGNTIQVSAFKLGTLFSGGLLVYLMDYLTVSATFTVLGCVYLCSLILLNLSLYNKEADKSEKETADSNLTFKEKIVLVHKSPGTDWICVFVILYKLGMFC